MRMIQGAALTLLVAGAVPAVGVAQTVSPPYEESYWRLVDRLDHPVPVATVTRSGDALALPHPQQGDGFVLGPAQLDLRNPDRPMVVFTITNATETPVPFSAVSLHAVRVNSRVYDGALRVSCVSSPWLSRPGPGDTALPPGASVTVSMPVAPRCGANLGETVGFLVLVEGNARPVPYSATAEARDLLHRAFVILRSQTQQ